MADILKPLDQKVGQLSLLDGALIGASKLATETLLSKVPFIGNGTFQSGMIKTVGAVSMSLLTGNKKTFQVISTGILIDGMEDIALNVKRYATAKMGGKSQTSETSAFA